MISVVIDTNVLVSARLRPDGPPALIMNLAAARKIDMFTSPEIWAEYEEVLFRPKFKLDPQLLRDALALIRVTSTVVVPKRASRKASDQKDNRFLAAARAVKAEFLITGNTKHFPKRYYSTQIVTPTEFLTLIGSILQPPPRDT